MPVLKQNEVFAGRYVLSELIGEGGFSEVWKAKDQMADEAVVAIKIYAPDKGLDDYGVRQFRKEFSLTHHLSHPHLLKVYHFDISDGSPYLIMPYCPFGSLARVLRVDGVFSERQVALAMCQIGSALEELHRQDPPILHQDIKPDNILVLHAECFLLADFGISSQIRHTLRKATSNMQSLTVAYAPPERFDRHPTTDSSSDIFSLGVTLYEMCTNAVPWDGTGGQCLLKGAYVPVLPEGFPAELNEILEACMSVDRSKRPTAAEIHARGRHFLETGKWDVPMNGKKVPAAKKSPVAYMAAAAIALAAIGGFWWYNGHTDSTERTAMAAIEQKNSRQLEEKIKELKAALAEANLRVVQRDSLNGILVQHNQELTEKLELADKGALLALERSRKQQAEEKAAAKDIQKYLNQISDPKISKETRSAWKQEILAEFSGGSARVLDESDGNTKEYRAGIFLTILLTSPHQVVVRDTKRDRNNKITELRVSKKSVKSAM